jgi:hypothetical protein
VLFAANAVEEVLMVARRFNGTFSLSNELHPRAVQLPTLGVVEDQNAVRGVERRAVLVAFATIIWPGGSKTTYLTARSRKAGNVDAELQTSRTLAKLRLNDHRR